MKLMIFDKRNRNWQNEDYNLQFIHHTEMYLNDLIEARGYLYANEVYESLGLKWNPEWENELYLYNEKYRPYVIQFEVFPKGDDGYLIQLLSNGKK